MTAPPPPGLVGVRRPLARRLAPLQVAVALQSFMVWVPVEKLFMTQIGFTPRTVAVMAAAYAAVVPLLEVPSGILADRWSRKLLMVGASVGLLASSLLGGLSTNVATYIAAAMLLGVYFALNSGTVDSIVYDVLVEETGSAERYETWIGRIRMVESVALVTSALAGGVLAEATSVRLTYFATLPFAAAAIVAFLCFDEPRLHRVADPIGLRSHVTLMARTMAAAPGIRQVILLGALVAMLSQAVFEFGPLWLVALAAPAALFGPYWAALVSTGGVGGVLTSRLNLDNRAVVLVLALAAPLATLLLTWTHAVAAVIAAQVVLALLLAIVGVRAGKLLHDGVPSNLRAGISSGVGTLSWMLFLPFSLVFGSFARAHSVQRAGWLLTAATLLVAILLIIAALRGHREPPAAVDTAPTRTPDELACMHLVELLTDYLDDVLTPELNEQFRAHLEGCDGCAEYVRQIALTINALRETGRQPQAE